MTNESEPTALRLESSAPQFRCPVHGVTNSWMKILDRDLFCLDCYADFLKRSGVSMLTKESPDE